MTDQQATELRDIIRRLDAAILEQPPSAAVHLLGEPFEALQTLACAILGHSVEGNSCVECGLIIKP